MTQIPYELGEDSDFQVSQSELIGALGNSDRVTTHLDYLAQ
jgi:hypothetical protein